MKKEDLKNYFDLYVSSYQPYKNLPEYQAIVHTLIEFYFNHSYNEIPLPFKQAFEEQIIPPEFYDNLLLSIGYTKKIISKLIEKDKKILLSSFMDYNRYKGTIEQFRKIGVNFLESIGIYELFIDFRIVDMVGFKIHCTHGMNFFIIDSDSKIYFDKIEINDIIIMDEIEYKIIDKVFDNENNSTLIYLDKHYQGRSDARSDFKIKRWVFIPEPVYIANDIEPINEIFSYNEIYRGTKQYFVEIDQLFEKYNNNDIVLPIKSNLIFLDYLKYQDVNYINNLFSAIMLKEYYNERLTIYFRDGAYSITLGKLYKLWYFILMKFFNYDYVDHCPTNVIMLYKDHANFNYKLSDIPIILEEYNNLKTTNEYSLYYYNLISSKLKVDDHLKIDLSLDQFYLILKNEIGSDLINYIINRIENVIPELKDYEYNFLLDELYNSVLTWAFLSSDSSLFTNIKYLLNNMSFITYPIEMSPSYNLILFYKPYHVELIKRLKQVIKNKEPGAVLEEKIHLYLKMLQASAFTVSNLLNYNLNLIKTESLNIIITTEVQDTKQIFRDYVNFLHKIINIIEFEEESVAEPNSIKFSVVVELNKINSILEVLDDYQITTVNDVDNNFGLNYISILMTSLTSLKWQYDMLLSIIETSNISISMPDIDASIYMYDMPDLNLDLNQNQIYDINHEYDFIIN